MAAWSAAIVIVAAGFALRPAIAPAVRLPTADPPDERRVGDRITVMPELLRRSTRPLAVGALAVLLDPVAAVAAVVVWCAWPPVRRITEERRRRAEVEAAIPDSIELLVLLLHAGLTPHQAVEEMRIVAPEPIVPGFEAVEARLARGAGLAEALGALTEVLGPRLASVADTLAISVRHGTPIGGVLDQLSNDVRLRRRRAAEAEARKLPVRLSFPLVFCTLPSFVLVAIAPAVVAALSSLGDTAW